MKKTWLTPEGVFRTLTSKEVEELSDEQVGAYLKASTDNAIELEKKLQGIDEKLAELAGKESATDEELASLKKLQAETLDTVGKLTRAVSQQGIVLSKRGESGTGEVEETKLIKFIKRESLKA